MWEVIRRIRHTISVQGANFLYRRVWGALYLVKSLILIFETGADGTRITLKE